MTIRTVDEDIRLIPYYRNDAASLPWYQDLDVCKQVDDRDMPYDAALLHRMYDYLCANGDCWYIEYRGTLVGNISLRASGEIAIVVCKAYQNRHIGRRCCCPPFVLKAPGHDRLKEILPCAPQLLFLLQSFLHLQKERILLQSFWQDRICNARQHSAPKVHGSAPL